MGQTAVSRRLIGEVPMDLDDLERFAAVLNVPLTSFLADQGSSTTRQYLSGSGALAHAA